MNNLLTRAVGELSSSSVLSEHIVYTSRLGGATDHVQQVDSLRTKVHGLLRITSEFVARRAIGIRDIPNALREEITHLTLRAANIKDTNDWLGLRDALDLIWAERGLLETLVVNTAIASVAERVSEGYQAASQLESLAKHSTKLEKQASDLLKEISAGHDQALSQVASISETLKDSNQLAAGLKKSETIAKKHSSEIESKRKAILESSKEVSRNRQASTKDIAFIGRLKLRFGMMLDTEASKIKTQDGLRSDLLDSLSRSEAEAKRILFDSTTAALARQWQVRRQNSSLMMVVTGVLLLVFVVVALFVSAVILFPSLFPLLKLSDGTMTFEERMAVKLVAAPPIIFAIWFLSIQFGHARDQAARYWEKETIAMSLNTYSDFLKGQAVIGDKNYQDQVFELITGTVRNLYALEDGKTEIRKSPMIQFGSKGALTLEEVLTLLERAAALPSKVGASG